MPGSCPECGAEVPDGGSCRDHFHALLALEWRIPGGPGELAHFCAVASYGLQHPVAMDYRAETVAGLRRAVADVLDGRTTVAGLRPGVRSGLRTAGRVTRRGAEPEVRWGVVAWPITVAHLLHTPLDRAEYTERATRWARSVLDALGPPPPA